MWKCVASLVGEVSFEKMVVVQPSDPVVKSFACGNIRFFFVMWNTRNAMTYLHMAMVNLLMPIRQSSSNEEENDENSI